MKKMMMMALVALVSLSLASCGKAKQNNQTDEQTECAETACCQEKVCLLAGEWVIVSAGEIAATEDVNKPAMTIENGTFGGQTGCNSFSGEVKCCPNSKRVAFSNVAVTKMMCQDSDAQEQAILKAINEAATFSVEDDVVTFMDAEGNALMAMRKAE